MKHLCVIFVILLCVGMPVLMSGQSVTFQTSISLNNTVKPAGTFDSGFIGPTALIQGRDGRLYGTTQTGGIPGTGFNCGNASGTFFRLTPSPVKLTTLHNFHQCLNDGDGQFPQSGIVL